MELSDFREALEYTRIAFSLSEQNGTPIMVRSTTRISHARGLAVLGEHQTRPVVDYR